MKDWERDKEKENKTDVFSLLLQVLDVCFELHIQNKSVLHLQHDLILLYSKKKMV